MTLLSFCFDIIFQSLFKQIMSLTFLTFVLSLYISYGIELNWSYGYNVLPTALYNAGIGIGNDDIIYLFGGYNNKSIIQDIIYKWDIKQSTQWSALNSKTPLGLSTLGSTVNMDGKMYIISPNIVPKLYSVVFAFDIVKEMFVTDNIKSIPLMVYNPCIIFDEMNGLLYLNGGIGINGEHTNYVQIYHVNENKWNDYYKPAVLPLNVVDCSCNGYNGYNYIFGGEIQNKSVVNSVMYYDIDNNEWILNHELVLKEHKKGLKSVVMYFEDKPYIFVIGGYDTRALNTFRSVEVFDPINKVMINSIHVDELLYPVTNAMIAVIQNRIFLFGGKYYDKISKKWIYYNQIQMSNTFMDEEMDTNANIVDNDILFETDNNNYDQSSNNNISFNTLVYLLIFIIALFLLFCVIFIWITVLTIKMFKFCEKMNKLYQIKIDIPRTALHRVATNSCNSNEVSISTNKHSIDKPLDNIPKYTCNNINEINAINEFGIYYSQYIII